MRRSFPTVLSIFFFLFCLSGTNNELLAQRLTKQQRDALYDVDAFFEKFDEDNDSEIEHGEIDHNDLSALLSFFFYDQDADYTISKEERSAAKRKAAVHEAEERIIISKEERSAAKRKLSNADMPEMQHSSTAKDSSPRSESHQEMAFSMEVNGQPIEFDENQTSFSSEDGEFTFTFEGEEMPGGGMPPMGMPPMGMPSNQSKPGFFSRLFGLGGGGSSSSPPMMGASAPMGATTMHSSREVAVMPDAVMPDNDNQTMNMGELHQIFEKVDDDGNGKLNEAELASLELHVQTELKTIRRQKREKKVNTSDALLTARKQRIKSSMRLLDRNKDGKVSKEELPIRMRINMDEIDVNKDGFIDQDELN